MQEASGTTIESLLVDYMRSCEALRKQAEEFEDNGSCLEASQRDVSPTHRLSSSRTSMLFMLPVPLSTRFEMSSLAADVARYRPLPVSVNTFESKESSVPFVCYVDEAKDKRKSDGCFLKVMTALRKLLCLQ